jgi:hypothetical protein
MGGAILADVVERDCRLIIGGQLSPELRLAVHRTRPMRAACNTVLTDHLSDRDRLQGLPQRASGPGFSPLEARAIDNHFQSAAGGDLAAARGGARSSSGRLQLSAAGVAP